VGADSSASAPGDTPEDVARRAAALHAQANEAGRRGQVEEGGDAPPARGRAARGERRARLALPRARGEPARQRRRSGGGARRTLASAGELALARGDVGVAADAFLKAGLVARDQGDALGSVALTRRAQMLANSKHLSDAERTEILGRILPR
jgi:hypothetical protein